MSMDMEMSRLLTDILTTQKELIRKVDRLDHQVQSDYRDHRDELRQLSQTNQFELRKIDERILDLEGANNSKNYKTTNERNNNET